MRHNADYFRQLLIRVWGHKYTLKPEQAYNLKLYALPEESLFETCARLGNVKNVSPSEPDKILALQGRR